MLPDARQASLARPEQAMLPLSPPLPSSSPTHCCCCLATALFSIRAFVLPLLAAFLQRLHAVCFVLLMPVVAAAGVAAAVVVGVGLVVAYHVCR